MAPRLARSSVQLSAPKSAKNKTRKRNLDAYAIASHSTASKNPVRQNRLGEYLDDAPRQKRRRVVQTHNDDDKESVEEDVSSVPKRRRTADEDADGDEGSDSEGNEWRLGGLRSDDSDSELDSDEAFGESDEEKFEGFTFRGSKSGNGGGKGKKTIRAGPASQRNLGDEDDNEMDLDEVSEGDNEGEDDFGDEGVDLATMLDNEDDDDLLGGKDDTREDLGEDSVSEDDEEEEGNSEDEPSVTSNDDDDDDGQDDEERAARMRDRLDAISAPKDVTTPTFADETLTIDDFRDPSDPVPTQQQSKTRKKAPRITTESAPLPKRQQDRLNREVATQKAKEQLDRWRDTVIHNRRAEFLSFPLQHDDAVAPVGKDKFVVDSTPQNELEEKIQQIMEESGLSAPKKKGDQTAEEDAILAAEGLGTNNLPVEEVMRRRADLRRTRELLFREERKAKRIAKIKSKSYRRVHRKERDRLAQLEEGLRGSDDEEDAREANDRKRAMARMSTKHRDSKFAKALRETGRAAWDEGAREAVLDEARRREELERRVRGEAFEEGSEESNGGDDEGWDGFAGDEEAREELDQLKNDRGDGQADGKGLQNLKFMRAADERLKKQNDEDVERLRKDMAVQDGDESEEETINEQGLGRAVFGPKAKEPVYRTKAKKGEMEEAEESDDDEEDQDHEEVTVVTDKPANKAVASGKAREKPLGKAAKAAKGSTNKTSNNGNITSSAWITVDTHKSSKDQRHLPTGKSDWLTTKTNRSKASNAEPVIDVSLAEHPSTDKTEQNGISDSVAANDAQKQKAHDYHTRAFAGDDVTASFAAEKSALAVEEDEQETSSHLPGWGSWTGAGLSKSIRRANAKQKHNPLFKTKTPGVRSEARKDKGRDDVIVSEKRMGKGKGREYLATVLPREFETRDQYERSLRVPVGPEWTTKEVFQRGTRPKVVVGRGKIVEALERPMV